MNPVVLSCDEHYRTLGESLCLWKSLVLFLVRGILFAEGKTPNYLCLGFIPGLTPQSIFLSGAPLPLLQSETIQQPGRELQLGSA